MEAMTPLPMSTKWVDPSVEKLTYDLLPSGLADFEGKNVTVDQMVKQMSSQLRKRTDYQWVSLQVDVSRSWQNLSPILTNWIGTCLGREIPFTLSFYEPSAGSVSCRWFAGGEGPAVLISQSKA